MDNQTQFPVHKNHRLKMYDYGASGDYYITICTEQRKKILCNISDEPLFEIIPTEIGKKVNEAIANIEKIYENAYISAYVLMPNHIHFILHIDSNTDKLKMVTQKGFDVSGQPARGSVPEIVKSLKSVTTRAYRKITGTQDSLWQKSFYDEIIERAEHYDNVYAYIEDNPRNWKTDIGDHKQFK